MAREAGATTSMDPVSGVHSLSILMTLLYIRLTAAHVHLNTRGTERPLCSKLSDFGSTSAEPRFNIEVGAVR